MAWNMYNKFLFELWVRRRFGGDDSVDGLGDSVFCISRLWAVSIVDARFCARWCSGADKWISLGIDDI
jgi:hypothetical protein